MAASVATSTASFLHPTLASKLHAFPPTNRLFSVPSPITRNPRVRVSPSRSSFEVEAEKPRAAIEMDAATESELRETGFMGMRKTKLVCTVGPACSSEDALERLARAGMSVARLNMCHGLREWHRSVIRAVKRMNRDKGFCVSLMMDTEGSQMHMVNHAAESTVKAEDGTMWLFTTAKFESPRPNTIQVNLEGFSEDIVVGDELLFDGGMATFEVVEKIGNDLNCKCTDPGLLLPRAKLSFWRDGVLVEKKSGLPTLSSKDWADIDFGISEGIDFIAISFVKDAHDIKHLKSYLSDKSEAIRVIAKIESLESIENLLDIVSASDGIMVARRDLGVHVSLEQIPTVQEVVTRLCRQLNKPVIVASQLLESMIECPTPTRAEVADVSEAVRQCADALMLSGESAVGSYADKALLVLHMTSTRMEMWRREENSQNMQSLPQLEFSLTERISEQISNSAVEMANNLGVDAIFVYTKHGNMASLLSRNRPNPPIFAFTDSARTRNWMNLCWGVMPFELPLSDEMEANFMETICFMRNHGTLKSGDVVLVVSDVDSAIYSSSQCIQVRTIF